MKLDSFPCISLSVIVIVKVIENEAYRNATECLNYYFYFLNIYVVFKLICIYTLVFNIVMYIMIK